MKIKHIIYESDLDDFKSMLKGLGDEVDNEMSMSDDDREALRNKRAKFSDIEMSFRDPKMFDRLLNILIQKGSKQAQKQYPMVFDEMVKLGLLNDRGGVTDRAKEYLEVVIQPNVGSPLTRYPDRYNADTIEKLEGKVGNFPPGVIHTRAAKDTMQRRDRGEKTTDNRHELRVKLKNKAQQALDAVNSRLTDRNRKR